MALDLTKGKIAPSLVRFTIPLVLGNLLQLTYNAVDGMVVGQFVGKEALAAVGICNPVSTLLILFLNGVCLGAGVLVGTLYGAKDYDGLHRQVSTTMLGGVGFSLALSLACILGSRGILAILQVEPELIPITLEYLHIILAGLCFTFLYNFFSSTMRALGDSAASLVFLAASAIINVIGDIFFVVVLDWGARGCAIATVLSEALSALFCLVYIRYKVPALRLGKKWLVFDKAAAKITLSYGWSGALQQSAVQMGKLCVQGMVNTMGVTAIAAYAIVSRIDDFAYTPQQNIGHSLTAFMAQNKGAGKIDRMQSGFRWGMVLEGVYGAIVALVCLVGARPLMNWFIQEEPVIECGVNYLKIIALMYLLPAATNGIQGYFRGIGQMKTTLRCTLLNMAARVAAAGWLVLGLGWQIEALPWANLAGWAAMLLYELPLLFRQYHQDQKALETVQ